MPNFLFKALFEILPSLVKTSYLTFFHFLRYVEILEAPYVSYFLSN